MKILALSLNDSIICHTSSDFLCSSIWNSSKEQSDYIHDSLSKISFPKIMFV